MIDRTMHVRSVAEAPYAMHSVALNFTLIGGLWLIVMFAKGMRRPTPSRCSVCGSSR